MTGGEDAAVAADLRAAARSVTSTDTRKEAADRAVEVLASAAGVEHTCVYLRNDSPPVLYGSVRSDAIDERFALEDTVAEASGPLERAVQGGQPVVGAAPEEPPAALGLDDAEGWALVPLGGEGLLVAVTPEAGGLPADAVAAVDLVGAYLEAALASHVEHGEMTDEARLEALSRAFPDYAFLYDADGRYLDVLLGWTNIQLYRRRELLGSTVHDVMEPEVAATVQGAIDEALATGEMQDVEYGVDTPGGVYWYEGRAVPVEDPQDGDGGGVSGVATDEAVTTDKETVVFVARDITERHEREQELQRKNERLEEFASIVSHDLRNPLNVAAAHVELVRDTGETEHLEAVDEAHERMESLIEDLLSLAREGRAVEDPEAVVLGQVVGAAWDAVDTGDASLAEDVGDAMVLADRGQLRQLLENLLRNALEHGSTGGAEDRNDVAVRVGTLPEGFFVEDDGPGVPEGEADAIFEPGHSPGGGTGLGLNIVEQVVDAHGWDVGVSAAEAFDDGARFEITGVEWV